MRKVPKQGQIQERGAGVARSESQRVIPQLETGSKSTAQPQPPPPQQRQRQFESEENRMVLVVEACRYIVEFETRRGEQHEHLQLPPKQQQQ